jgi:hypothetical protein
VFRELLAADLKKLLADVCATGLLLIIVNLMLSLTFAEFKPKFGFDIVCCFSVLFLGVLQLECLFRTKLFEYHSI